MLLQFRGYQKFLFNQIVSVCPKLFGKRLILKKAQNSLRAGGNILAKKARLPVFYLKFNPAHITCNDGKTTNAVYKVNGKIEKREKAVCSPSDTFDFATGQPD